MFMFGCLIVRYEPQTWNFQASGLLSSVLFLYFYSMRPSKLLLLRGILFTAFLFIAFWTLAPGLAKNLFPESQFYSGTFLITRIFCWFIVGILWNYSNKMEQRSLLILKPQSQKPHFYYFSVLGLIAINYTGAIILSYILMYFKWQPGGDHEAKTMIGLFKNNNSLLYLTALTAGVTEELIFRGYLQTRIAELLKGGVWGIIISSLLFGLMHISGGSILSAIFPVYIGLVHGIYYQKYKNMHVVIVVHFLWDVFALYALLYSERL